jgi:outer membrane lipoprotein-sorting protein
MTLPVRPASGRIAIVLRLIVMSWLVLVATEGPAAAGSLAETRKADLQAASAYLNSIKTLKARFLQVSPDGQFAQGEFLLRRPGRLRFEYDPPSPFLVLADGFLLHFLDRELGEPQSWPIKDTPLGVLVAEDVDLVKDGNVEGILRRPGTLEITLRDQDRPDEGTVTLVFSADPLILRQWKIVDAQKQKTTVTLDKIETGLPLHGSLFIMPGKKELDAGR